MRHLWIVSGLAGLLLLAVASPAPAQTPADYDAAAGRIRRLLAELVAANTSNPPGHEARAAQIGARWLGRAGITAELFEFEPGRQNLVARLRGSGAARPLLLLAHTDVVGTTGQSWTTPPHQLVEKDGFLYGRGVGDDLGMAATALEVMRLLKRQGTPLRRDIILAWTGDEESGGKGIKWQLQHRRASIDAEVALNEGGGVVLGPDGRPRFVALQVAEKIYRDYEITARGPTGHSSVPLADNAIYRLSRALDRLGRHRFPVRLLPVTRAFLSGRARREEPRVAAAMQKVAATPEGQKPDRRALAVLEESATLAASLRSTCVATVLRGGTRENALPASALANVNCRLLPDETVEQMRLELQRILGDPTLQIRALEHFTASGSSPVEGPGPAAVRKVIERLWPGVPVVPFISRGGTDSRQLRAAGIAAYGLVPIGNTEADGRRAHGIDERIPATGLRSGVELLHKLVLELAAAPR